MKYFYLILSALAVFSLNLVLSAKYLEAEEPALYYILDASGSMWGRVQGELKITVAKRTLGRLMQETPAGTIVALTAYGHRRQADCSDIEELSPLSPVNLQLLNEKITALTPRGKTPLTQSIQFAAEALKGKNYDATIVLISVGIETCQKDPCAATRALKESGLKFRLHVVGFGVGDEAREQLSCIAQAGGGNYFTASNAADLLATLTQVKQNAIEKKELPTPAPSATPVLQQVSSSATSIRVKAKGPGRVRLVLPQWVSAPYHWKLLDAETGEEKAKFKELAEQIVPPGEYQLSWRQIEHASSDVALGEAFSVRSGESTELKLMTGFHPVPAEWVPTHPYYWSLRDPQTSQEIARFRSDFEPKLVPPGQYELVYRQTEHGSTDSFLGLVEIKEDVLNELPLNTGVGFVHPAGLAAPYLVEFIELDSQGNTTTRKTTLRQSFGPMALKPGTYRINYRQKEHEGSTITIADNLEVPAGSLVELEL